MRRRIFSLGAKEALNPRLAGGKVSGLARLASLGYPIPAGFVIGIPALRSCSSRIFRQFLNEEKNIIPQFLDEAREQFLNIPLPISLQTAIETACQSSAGPWAVRSSMLGEDSQKSSFAGLLDTFLNVRDQPSVIEAVQKCLASMCNWRLWSYQLEIGLPLKAIRKRMAMAVIVQEMIAARVSGIAFGANPGTGRKDIVIEAVPGTGEDIVQGRVAPHRYVLNDLGSLDYFPPQDGGSPYLEDQDVLRLAESVQKISERIGSPQDIEWAFDGRDFFFLQCRPITALPTQRVYSSHLVSEMSPGLIKPLMWSTKTRSMVRVVFGRISTELLGPNHIDFAKYIKRIHSRIYADMTAFGEFLERLGLPPNFFEMITRQEKPQQRLSFFRTVKISKLGRFLRFARRYSAPAKEMAAFVENQCRKLEYYRRSAWDKFSLQGLLDIFDKLLKLHAKTQWYVFIGPMNMTIRYRLLGRILARHAPGANPGEILSGIDGLKALEPNAHIMAMGAIALKLPSAIRELMLLGASPDLEAKLVESEEGRKLLDRFHNFMGQYGFLSANGSDFSATPWIEDPGPIWKSIGRFAQQAEAGMASAAVPERGELIAEVRHRLNILQRLIFGWLLASTRNYVKLRESISLIMSEETYLIRRALKQMGSILEEQGAVGRASDIFYLYYDELREWLVGDLRNEEARRRIALRKEEMKRDARIEVPDTFCGEAALFGPRVSEKDEFLKGISGSPGKAHGIARVVHDPASLKGPLTAEDILVVPFTDVGWTPLLPGIRGIVAETGGQLSHTSIIAREYGLPAVVSVKGATRLIRDGQLITIDGSLGRVYRHSGAQKDCGGKE